MRIDVGLDLSPLLQTLRDPERLRRLSAPEFSRLIDVANQARLLGWLLTEIDARNMSEPAGWLGDRITTVRRRASEDERAVRWEIDRVRRAFWGCHFPWVLLKGAAYIAMATPPGRGRRVADIDVLVPAEDLADAEAALQRHDWRFPHLDAYETRYYREWMHELPPLVHRERKSVVDLHHAILPRTSRLHPSTARLIERSIAVQAGVRVLCPSHLTLHAAAHLFHDGEIAGALRDLVDLDALFRWFARDPGFWSDFVGEAHALGLIRPAYYAVRYAHRLMGTPVDAEAAAAIEHWKPPAPVQQVMDWLVDRTLLGQGSSAAAYALYIRSHWLRMPPLLLTRHLLRKSLRRP